jgi:hypothetical protein
MAAFRSATQTRLPTVTSQDTFVSALCLLIGFVIAEQLLRVGEAWSGLIAAALAVIGLTVYGKLGGSAPKT